MRTFEPPRQRMDECGAGSLKRKGLAVSARPFLDQLIQCSTNLDGRGVTDPCPAGLAGLASDPGGSDPAAAVRVSARRPAVDPASARGSGSVGRDSGSDWTSRSPFFKVAEGQLWNLPLVARNLGSRPVSLGLANRGSGARLTGSEKLALYKLLRRRPAQLPRWVPAVKNRNDATSGCRSLRCVKTRKRHSTVGSVWIISPSN
jgi:hypothetical protein